MINFLSSGLPILSQSLRSAPLIGNLSHQKPITVAIIYAHRNIPLNPHIHPHLQLHICQQHV